MVPRCKGLETLRDAMGQGAHLQEEAQGEARERRGGLGVQVEPGGLALDWWLETWSRRSVKPLI